MPPVENNRINELIDRRVSEINLIGKTKKEVIEILGDIDTTNATLIYDFSSFDPYVLEIEFENNRVVRYRKKEQ